MSAIVEVGLALMLTDDAVSCVVMMKAAWQMEKRRIPR
jgi:hypothetical protein